MAEPLVIAKNSSIECALLPALANRHGLITGATGTGKTVTLQTLAEGFSKIGVPVFMADVKGDLTGISQAGSIAGKMAAILKERNIDLPERLACPTTLWDVFGEQGHPVRATISDMGPLLLGRMLALNETQQCVLQLVFKIADDHGLALLDLKDLRAMLQYVGDNAKEFTTEYGNISAASVGAIQRGLLQIEEQGGDKFFGEPMLDISDFMQTVDGKGVVNILAADKLMNSPRLYATFLLWLMSELFEQLPEVGDPDKPKLVFFFDEAHLLFRDTPKALMEKVEQVVRLIRSKGVGIYFVTQNPADIPDSVLAQLGNRIQHALRAYTPSEQRGLRAASESFRPNPDFDTATAIQELGVGEALVSTLDEKGAPTVVQKTLIRPPASRLGPATDAERAAVMAASPVKGLYDTPANRESAHELLQKRANEAVAAAKAAEAEEARRQERDAPAPSRSRSSSSGAPRTRAPAAPRRSNRQSTAEAFGKSVARSIGSQVGRALVRGILGSLTRR